MRTSLLIPCYNEAEGIPNLCQRLRELVPLLDRSGGVEILFVDDGSTDGTAEVIGTHAQGLPYRILTHERNRGLGAALKTGMAASTGMEMVTMDSDCTFDPMFIPDMLRDLRKGYDIVTASPYHPLGRVIGVPGWRLLLSKTVSRIYGFILPQRLYSYTSCFRAYRRDIIPVLKGESDDFLCVTQFLISAILRGARVAEFPTSLTKRQFGQSKIKILEVIWSHLKYISQVARETVSLRVRGSSYPVRVAVAEVESISQSPELRRDRAF